MILHLATFAFVLGLPTAGQTTSPADALFDRFFAADNPADAAVVGEQIAAVVDFDTAYARLKKGRTYLDEKRGEYSLRWRSKTGPFFNNVIDVYELPQGVMLDVRREKGTVLIPFRSEIVTEVDRAARRIVISPPEGLLE